jgi:hypothetical protein
VGKKESGLTPGLDFLFLPVQMEGDLPPADVGDIFLEKSLLQ